MNEQTYKLYDGEVELVYNDDDHTYKVDDDIVYGVTSITDVLHKPALMYWAIKCAVNHLEDNWEPGEEDEISKKELLKKATHAHQNIKGEAADIGDLFHKWAEQYFDPDREDPDEPKNETLKKSVAALLEWEEEHEIEVEAVERKVYSREYNYAGTLDMAAVIDGDFTILDFKTSKSIYNNYFMQAAAYAQAWREEFEKPDQIAILRVGKGKKEFEYRTLTPKEIGEHLQGFLGAKPLYIWEQKVKAKNIRKKYGKDE